MKRKALLKSLPYYILFFGLISGICFMCTTFLERDYGISMMPTIHPGNSVLYSRIFDRNHIANGSIILYDWDPAAPHNRTGTGQFTQNSSMTISHRIIGEGSDLQGVFYITKGDYNSMCDPFLVRPGQITGVAILIIR